MSTSMSTSSTTARTVLTDHPLRRPLTDELHARPFTPLEAPAQILSIAFKPVEDGVVSRAAADREHLDRLLDHLDAPRSARAEAGSSFLSLELGELSLRWERHSEFVSLALRRARAPGAAPFAPDLLDQLPQAWVDAAGGPTVSAVLLELERAETEAEAEARMLALSAEALAADSLAAAWVSDRQALAMSDFRIDQSGFTRIAVLTLPQTGPRRLGRLTQRMIELETYRMMAMLAFPTARAIAPRLGEIDAALTEAIAAIPNADTLEKERSSLETLTELAGEVERLSAESAFRFSAARAYEGIVQDRVAILHEQRAAQRQTFTEFMARRFKPAMRTCASVAERLDALTGRAARAGDLLSTRVEVSLEEQNQKLLQSMDARAKLQLRLQQTVEGLSVVAISYYAVSLAGYLLAPLAEAAGRDVKTLMALAAAPIIAAVWWFVAQIRKRAEQDERDL